MMQKKANETPLELPAGDKGMPRWEVLILSFMVILFDPMDIQVLIIILFATYMQVILFVSPTKASRV